MTEAYPTLCATSISSPAASGIGNCVEHEERHGEQSNAAYASRQSGCAAFWIAFPSLTALRSGGGASRLKIPLRALDRTISVPCSFSLFGG
jgi:hypothetical protein